MESISVRSISMNGVEKASSNKIEFDTREELLTSEPTQCQTLISESIVTLKTKRYLNREFLSNCSKSVINEVKLELKGLLAHHDICQ